MGKETVRYTAKARKNDDEDGGASMSVCRSTMGHGKRRGLVNGGKEERRISVMIQV